MFLKQEVIISEIEALIPLHAELLGDEGLHWIIKGNKQAQVIEGGSSIDLTESFRMGLEAFHYILLLSSVLLHFHEQIKKASEQNQAKEIKNLMEQLLISLKDRFPDIEDENKIEAINRIQHRLEEIDKQ